MPIRSFGVNTLENMRKFYLARSIFENSFQKLQIAELKALVEKQE